jgi:hypothetical protein
MDTATLKLAAQYGIGGVISLALVWLLGRILWKIGERMIAAIDALAKSHNESASKIADRFDQLADRFDEHTRADVQALKSVQVSVANLDGKFDAVLDKLDRTPVHGTPLAEPEAQRPQRMPTPITGTRVVDPPTAGTTYHHKRGRTNG